MKNSNIMVVVKKILLILHKPQPYGHWQVNGARLGLRFSAKTMVISQKLSEISMR